MWKIILKLQIITCIVLVLLYCGISKIDNPQIEKIFNRFIATVSTNYTVSDIAQKGKNTVSAIVNIPTAVTEQVISSTQQQEFGLPIAPVSNGESTPVYATAGGRVSETGSSKSLGNYVILQHENQNSIYGNCSKIHVKSGEHVRKGQVIASYKETEEKDFIYRMTDR